MNDGVAAGSIERVQAVEALGVSVQHRVLVFVCEMFVFDDLLDLVFAVVVVDFVRKIAGEHKGLIADRFDQMVQRLFRPFAADEDSSRLDVLADVCADGLARRKLEVFFARIRLSAMKPFQPPSGGSDRITGIGKFLRDYSHRALAFCQPPVSVS